jgi:hypothetical protein
MRKFNDLFLKIVHLFVAFLFVKFAHLYNNSIEVLRDFSTENDLRIRKYFLDRALKNDPELEAEYEFSVRLTDQLTNISYMSNDLLIFSFIFLGIAIFYLINNLYSMIVSWKK